MVGTSSILDRQLSLIRGLTPHILIVVSETARVRDQLASRRDGAEIPIAIDHIAGAGALGGVYTALMEAPTDQVLVIACDMPFLTAPFLTYLAECGRDADAAVPRNDHGRHPLCASYARRTAGSFLARIRTGDLRVGEALRDLAVRELGPDELVPFDRDGRLLLNINTPDDYARARLAFADGGNTRTTRSGSTTS